MFSFFEKVEAKYEKLFFDLNIKSIDNEIINLNEFKGKTVLLVNVASKCGFTKQYTGLQTLYEKYKEKDFLLLEYHQINLVVKNLVNKEIKDFCETNFNITFPITDKVDVKGNNAHTFISGQKKIMVIQQFLNGTFIKF